MKTSTLRNQNILATFRRHSPWLILMMVMLLTTGFARALGADMTSLIVDRLETGGEGLGLLILVVCLVQFVNYFTKFVSATSCTALQKKLEVSLRVQILRTLQRIPFGEFEGIDPGVAQTILRKDVEGAAKYLYVVFSRIGVSVTTLCFTAWFMLRIDPWVTCVLLAIAVCLGFLNRRVLARLKELNLRAIGGSKELGIGDWLEEVGLEHLLLENASDLSGGQKQILSVLQAVNFDASILILDEPFASLDAGRREKLAAFLEEYKRDHLVILTSHQEEQLDGVKVCAMG